MKQKKSMKQTKLILLSFMLFCSINGYGYKWKGIERKIWSEMTDQEILDQYKPYIQNRTFYCEITKNGVNYTTDKIEGFTYQYCYTALDGWITNYTREEFMGYFRFSDKPSIIGMSTTWNDTIIYDEAGIKHAREVVFKNWKKQFGEKIEGKARVVSNNDYYSGRITIPEKITVNRSDKIVLKYIEDSYYDDFWTSSVSLTEFANMGGGDVYVVGAFEVTDVSHFNASQEGLKSVSFPTTITKGFPSLENCVNLEKVEFSSKATSMPILKGCKSLKFLNSSTEGYFKLPSTLEWLGSFTECEELKQIVIPDNVKELEYTEYHGNGLFQDCTSLTSIVLGKGIPYLSNNMFKGCTGLSSITIPSQITSIDDFAFSGCTDLAEVLFEDESHLETIGSRVFESCDKIKQLSFPKPLKRIGGGAFSGCTALEVLVLPSTIESLGSGIIYGSILGGCINLLDIYVHMTEPFEISNHLFEDYSEGYPMEHIYYDAYLHVPSGTVADYRKKNGWNKFAHITSFKSPLHSVPAYGIKKRVAVGDFNYIINTSTKEASLVAGNYSEMTSAQIPSVINWESGIYKVTDISARVFYEHKLYSAILSDNLVSIGREAFANSNIKGMTPSGPLVFPEGMKSIGERAYYKCTRVHNIELPSTLESIGEEAFWPGYNIQEIISKMTTPIEVPDNAFPFDQINTENEEEIPILYVPVGTKKLYDEMDCWNKFRIFEIPMPEESKRLNEGETFTADMSGTIGIFVVTGSKTVNLRKCGNVSRVEVPSTITYNGVEYTITGILGTATGNANQPNHPVFGSNVTEVVIPNTVESIGACAFWYCKNMTSVTIPSSVTSIGDNAFLGSGLTSVIIPAGMTSIGEWAFTSCSSLKKVVAMDENPVNISGNPRFSDDILQSATLYMPSGKTTAYKNAGWNFTNIVELSALNDGDTFEATVDGTTFKVKVLSTANKTCQIGADSRGDAIVSGGKGWDGVIPTKVTGSDYQEYTVIGIGNRAFYEYDGRKSFTLPETLQQLSEGAFMRCHNLEYITIPAGLKTFGSYTFNGQESLKEVVSLIENPQVVNGTIDCGGRYGNNATLVVPAGKKSVYENAEGWKSFQRIVEMKTGDADGDGEVTLNDVKIVKKYIMTGKADGIIFNNADTNGNKQLNVIDIVKMLNIIKN